jgi:hypothetical protein
MGTYANMYVIVKQVNCISPKKKFIIVIEKITFLVSPEQFRETQQQPLAGVLH